MYFRSSNLSILECKSNLYDKAVYYDKASNLSILECKFTEIVEEMDGTGLQIYPYWNVN